MSAFDNGIRSLFGRPAVKGTKNTVSAGSVSIVGSASSNWATTSEDAAMKLSAVDRCVEVISDSIGKLPIYIINKNTREEVKNHRVLDLLSVRPNPVQTPMDCKKMIEANRLCGGNGYAFVEKENGIPVRITPIPYGQVTVELDRTSGLVFYSFSHPFTNKGYTRVPAMDMIHVKGYSTDGYKGISVLQRAADVIGTARAAQAYAGSYYANGGHPSGVLETDTDIGGTVEITRNGVTETVSKKDLIRDEWQKVYGGPTNANKIAVLDMGLKYTPINVSNADAQFIEQMDLSVQDIARFFGVPLYKLQSGKQSYSSNEQNAIEYVVSTLHPIVEKYEEELTYKLLTASEVRDGLQIKIDMDGEMRGDSTSRATWYRNMREISVFSPNDIRAMEDLPDVEGGDERYASLNYVPLKDFEELSRNRNSGNQNGAETV